MKSKLLLSLLCAAVCVSPVFAEDTTAATTTTVATETTQQATKDGQIIDVITTLDKNEITSAKMAIKKATNAQVKEYAQYLLDEHSQNLKDAMKISKDIKEKPVASAQAKDLKQKGKEEMKTLSSLKGVDFDKAYIQAMVKGHEEAINLVDNELLKSVTNPALKEFLDTTRGHLETHLDKAKKIEA